MRADRKRPGSPPPKPRRRRAVTRVRLYWRDPAGDEQAVGEVRLEGGQVRVDCDDPALAPSVRQHFLLPWVGRVGAERLASGTPEHFRARLHELHLLDLDGHAAEDTRG